MTFIRGKLLLSSHWQERESACRKAPITVVHQGWKIRHHRWPALSGSLEGAWERADVRGKEDQTTFIVYIHCLLFWLKAPHNDFKILQHQEPSEARLVDVGKPYYTWEVNLDWVRRTSLLPQWECPTRQRDDDSIYNLLNFKVIHVVHDVDYSLYGDNLPILFSIMFYPNCIFL